MFDPKAINTRSSEFTISNIDIQSDTKMPFVWVKTLSERPFFHF